MRAASTLPRLRVAAIRSRAGVSRLRRVSGKRIGSLQIAVIHRAQSSGNRAPGAGLLVASEGGHAVRNIGYPQISRVVNDCLSIGRNRRFAVFALAYFARIRPIQNRQPVCYSPHPLPLTPTTGTCPCAPAAAPRPIRMTRPFTKHAEGSVLVEFGDTQVICTASIEERVPPFSKAKGAVGSRRNTGCCRVRAHPDATRG